MLSRAATTVDDALTTALAWSDEAVRRWRARGAPREKAYFRGRACRCQPGAAPHLLHSEALREGCDVVFDYGSNVEHPRRRQVPLEWLGWLGAELAPGDAVYVKSDNLPAFVEHVLPGVVAPIVLVTGDSDFSPLTRFWWLLDDPRIAHWFAQNCEMEEHHPKLTRLPIGLDNPVYTRLEKRVGVLAYTLVGRNRLDPTLSRNELGDQTLLREVWRARRRRLAEKPLRALCTFHQAGRVNHDLGGMPARREAYEALRDNPACWFAPRRLGQAECWRAHDELAFEISPRGKGLDCFRTWEALFLETVPIVKRGPLDRLYRDEGLPVVIVESWQEVTPASLARWRDELADRFTPELVEKLTVDYWLAKVRRAGAAARSAAG